MSVKALPAALRAAALYFAVVFLAGFVLGTIRTLIILPRLGGTLAVALEIPLMLAVSWYACAWTLHRLSVPNQWRQRLLMGFAAFGLLLSAEAALALAITTAGLAPPSASKADIAASLLGLAAQAAFAVFPLFQGRQARRAATI